MASIQSLGVGSGLLTSELVEDIIAAEREATDLRLESRRLEVDAEISAFGAIRNELERLRSATAALSSSDTFLSNIATSSNPQAATATADGSANPGVHSVEVLALARAQTLTSTTFDGTEAPIGQGTLTFRFGETTFTGLGEYDTFTAREDGTATTVTIDESNNTLAGLRDAINAEAFGVTASIVDDGSGSVLVLRSDSSGLEQSLEIVVDEDVDNPGLASFAFAAGSATAGVNLTQVVAADDAVVRIDGIQVQRDTNTIDNVVAGLSFEAVSLNVGAPATISVTQDVAAIEERMSAFVDAFNGVKVLADELTDFDTESQQGALLTGDATLRSISSQLRRFLAAPIDGLEDSGFRSLVDVGLTTNQDLGFILSFDAAQFTRLLQEDTRGLTTLLTDDVRATDSQLEVRSFSDATAAGTYAVEITQVATNGRNTGAALASLSGATVIDANNDSLRVSIDGVASEEIVLTAGTYADSDALAAELERQINADRLLRDADRSVDVVFDSASEQLLILSNRFGSGSTVAIDAVDSSTAATLGFSESDGVEEAGLDVAGLVDGVPGQGSGQFLQVPLGPAPASGARLDGTEISFPLTVVAAADTFSLTVDGTNTGTLTVPAATYNSGAELAAAITTAVNDSAPITASGQTIEARFDPSAGRLVLASTTTGQSSTLRLEAIDETLAGQLGLTVGAESIGTNAGRQDSAVGGLQIRVTGGDVGARGEVSVIRGAMNGLDRFLDTLLSSSGALRTRVDGLEERLADIDTEAVDFDERMDALEERLRFQFAAADALISQLNNTSSFLEQQLASLPGVSRDES